jgi:hypothetical protein
VSIKSSKMRERYIKIDSEGNTFHYCDKFMYCLHRDDGPAIEYANGGKFWYIEGSIHREDGPAAEFPNGDKMWYVKNKLHREDGPAKEYADGRVAFYLNGDKTG